jgi:hypothetical protein
MNLIENIQRINTLISENDRDKAIRNMIDKMGVADAIKMTGNYYVIEPYLKEIDKVNFIKDKIKNQYYGLFTYGDEGWDENDYSVLESTETYEKVAFTYYTDELDVTTFYRDENGDHSETIKYEDLPDDMINNAFEFIAKKI